MNWKFFGLLAGSYDGERKGYLVVSGFLKGFADPVPDGEEAEEGEDDEEGIGEHEEGRPDAAEGGPCPDDEGAVTFAHGAIVTAGGSDLDGDAACCLRGDGEDGEERCEGKAYPRNETEGEVECGVGKDIAQFIQEGSELTFLVKLSSQHAIDCIQGHADEEDGRVGENRDTQFGIGGEGSGCEDG